MFSFIKNTLTKIYTSITSRLGALFGSREVDAKTLQELEIILLSADTGAHTTRTIIEQLKADFHAGKISQGDDLKKALAHILKEMLAKPQPYISDKKIILLVGINGSGENNLRSQTGICLYATG